MKLGKVVLYGALYYVAYKLLTKKSGGSLYGLGAVSRPKSIARALQLGILQQDEDYPGIYFVQGRGWMTEIQASQYAYKQLLLRSVAMSHEKTPQSFWNDLPGAKKFGILTHTVGDDNPWGYRI